VRRDGDPLAPTTLVGQTDDPGAGGGSGAVGGRRPDHSGHVLAWGPAVGPLGEQRQLPAVDGVAGHLDDDVVGARLGLGQVTDGETGAEGSVRYPSMRTPLTSVDVAANQPDQPPVPGPSTASIPDMRACGGELL